MIERKRKGFTLVELLVVISIITMLMALLIPAIQSAKESARILQCSNNLHQLGMGVLMYNKTYQRFPGYRTHLKPSPKVVTWMIPILPYLGETKIYNGWARFNYDDRIELYNAWPASPGKVDAPRPRLEVFACPSNPPRVEELAPSDYACNAGYAKQTDYKGERFDLNYPDYRRNGVFLDHSKTNARTVTLDYLHDNDGTSTTLMLGENTLVPSWATWMPTSLLEETDSQGNFEIRRYLPKQYMGFVWHHRGLGRSPYVNSPYDDLKPERRINGDYVAFAVGPDNIVIDDDCPIDPENPPNKLACSVKAYINYARIASFHPHGSNVTFCDGHNRFLNESLNYFVYIQLMTPDHTRSKEANETPKDVYVLNEGHY